MLLDRLIEEFRLNPDKEAIIWDDFPFNYSFFLTKIVNFSSFITQKIPKGSVVSIESEMTPYSIAFFLACIQNNMISIPITLIDENQINNYLDIAHPDYRVVFKNNKPEVIKFSNSDIELYNQIRNKKSSGLVLFSSGSTGTSKAAVHDLFYLLKKFEQPGKDLRTLVFMYYDHIGGIDTLFYSLSNNSTIVIVNDRSPRNILSLVEKWKVEVLPATPSFLNMMLLSEDYKKFDLSSIKYITYGTEPMSDFTLNKVNEIFPDIKIIQKYGTTETGTLRSRSKSNTSTFIKLGDQISDIRVVEGILQIKASTSMLGYINAPSPFTEDGWFITGDKVEEKDGFLKILGRETEIINVGGEKVYPAEVENLLQEIDEVIEATVYGEANSIMGNIVCAKITINDSVVDKKLLKKKIQKFCKSKVENYKVPVKIQFTSEKQHGDRFKKLRKKDGII